MNTNYTSTVDKLTRWLLERGLGEERQGYGHATCEDIAEQLLAEFDITSSEERE